jgi:PAS domain S-box-containing protein
MRPNEVVPTGVERTFGADEIIVSKTDTTGRITYANDVFLRMCACPESEVLGRPHNFIRHPDMPRCVFKLLWDTIQAGDEIFAYVLNLATDGAHYWVLAHVTPSFGPDGSIIGYHSNRRSPARSAVDAIRPVYAALLAEERRHSSPVEAIAAGGALLGQYLHDHGTTYDELVWSLTNAEVAA